MKRTVIVPTTVALVTALVLLGGCRRGETPTGSPDTGTGSSARGASAPDMTASMPAPRASGG